MYCLHYAQGLVASQPGAWVSWYQGTVKADLSNANKTQVLVSYSSKNPPSLPLPSCAASAPLPCALCAAGACAER